MLKKLFTLVQPLDRPDVDALNPSQLELGEASFAYLWNVFSNVNEWLRFSDTKAAAIIVANGTIVTIGLSSSVAIVSLVDKSPLYALVVLVGLFCLSVSTLYALDCLQPRLKVGEPSSLIFYGHIAQKYAPTADKSYSPADAYDLDLASILSSAELARKELTCQIWANSRVGWQKYQKVACAVKWLFYALIAIFVLFVISLISGRWGIP